MKNNAREHHIELLLDIQWNTMKVQDQLRHADRHPTKVIYSPLQVAHSVSQLT